MSTPNRLPPGQQLVGPGKWPVIGERQPRDDRSPWSLSVGGLVERALTFSLPDLTAFSHCERVIDIHCVTRWSKLSARFGGVLLADVLQAAGLLPQARFIALIARSERSHSTSLEIKATIEAGTLLALDYEGSPLPAEHGGPLRVVTPGRYFYKSLKWLERIEVLATDQLGYWEREAGYHNGADPWREERYIAPRLSRQEAAAVLASRNVAGRDLMSLAASGRDLSGLVAEGALLRNADFANCQLANARFDGANLSNAHFHRADLRRASFRHADVEGADFRGTDLRGADFRGASLIGATFCDTGTGGISSVGDATLDATTLIDAASSAQLTPIQRDFVWQRLADRPSP